MTKKTISFIHTGDWHLTSRAPWGGRSEQGHSRRLLDVYKNISKMIRFAEEQTVDFILVCGDIFDCVPDEEMRRSLSAILGELMYSEIPTLITIGQHDIGPRRQNYLQSFREAIGSWPLSVQKNIEIVDELRSVVFAAKEPLDSAEVGQPLVNLIIQPWQRKIDPRLWAGYKREDIPNILVGHFPVQGAWASDTFQMDRGVPQNALNGFEYVALGDFHSGDQLFYSGSISRVTFAEKSQKKGFKCVELERETGKLIAVHFIDVKDRPFVQWNVAEADTGTLAVWGDVGTTPTEKMQRVKDAVVKVVVKGSMEFVHDFTRRHVANARAWFDVMEAWDVFFVYEVESRIKENRSGAIRVGMSIEDAIKTYVEEQLSDESGATSTEKCDSLIGVGNQLIVEAREE